MILSAHFILNLTLKRVLLGQSYFRTHNYISRVSLAHPNSSLKHLRYRTLVGYGVKHLKEVIQLELCNISVSTVFPKY